MYRKLMTLILTSACLSGCATSSGNFCTSANPIMISKSDTLTRTTKEQILSHNEFGSKTCGW